MGAESRARAERRVGRKALEAYRRKWGPIVNATHPSWQWLAQLIAYWDFQKGRS